MAEEKMDLHRVDPAEELQNVGLSSEKMVTDKWVNERQQPSLVTEADRKTGKVSDAANEGLQNGTKPNS